VPCEQRTSAIPASAGFRRAHSHVPGPISRNFGSGLQLVHAAGAAPIWLPIFMVEKNRFFGDNSGLVWSRVTAGRLHQITP